MAKKRSKKQPKKGQPTKIASVIRKLKKYASSLPIRSFKMIQGIAGVCDRTLSYYYAQGATEYEQGIQPYDTKTRKGSRHVQFYLMIQSGRERAHLAAIGVCINALNNMDIKAAFKYLAITDPKRWAEIHNIKHDGEIKTDNPIYEELCKLTELYTKRKKDESGDSETGKC